MRIRLGLLAALAALAILPAAAAGCPRTTLADVEDEVMCPVCGVPLELATEAPQAQRERAFIQRLVRSCRSKDQVKRALVAQFGERVLAKPRDDGFDLAAYLVPALGLALAVLALALAAWRWRRQRRDDRGSRAAAPTGQASARLDADLDRYDL
ncbi:MAG: cytochrome c-type biogenesis protein CcmH [Thermoleophilaceae bacterium]